LPPLSLLPSVRRVLRFAENTLIFMRGLNQAQLRNQHGRLALITVMLSEQGDKHESKSS
jgi:hypothetical protein